MTSTTPAKKILIVDDDARNIFALSLTLRSKRVCLPCHQPMRQKP
jgi:CheY-like chemotaxis protein